MLTNQDKKKIIWLIAIILMVSYIWSHSGETFAPGLRHRSQPVKAINTKKYSTDDPKSIWVVVNKARQINPREYEPADLVTPNVPIPQAKENVESKLRKEAASALENMFAEAKKQKLELMMGSGYRAYKTQEAVYNNFVDMEGRSAADNESARPGYSEHQTGLAADIEPKSRKCEIEDCFANTPEGKWLAENAYKFGFIIRYQNGQQKTVGYKYEPWHIRYVGIEMSTFMHDSVTKNLEDVFKLPAAPDYK